MYHAIAVEDMLDLYNATRAHSAALTPWQREAAAAWATVVPEMRRWARALLHPDGDISFFSDAAMGIAPPPAELERYADRLGIPTGRPLDRPVTVLSETGYVRVELGPLVALLDVGEIGPAYLPAHGHADVLSFELSLFGQRVFVNSGTSEYGSSPERLRQRGTAAHNTVVVDGENSSEVWGGFRVARRAHPRDFALHEGDPLRVVCAHDGFHRSSGRPRHRREWSFRSDSVVIKDRVAGRFDSAAARYHLHPSIRSEEMTGGSTPTFRLTLPDGREAFLAVEGAGAVLVPATWHPEFGRTVTTRCLVVVLVDGAASVTLKWVL
jgi:uncharacterized heparinase superfamily protein